MNENISNELSGLISQMLKPLKGLSFKLIIEGLSGHKIIPFDKNDEKDIALLEKLKNIAILTGKEINEIGIKKMRPNEAGNEVEVFLKNAMIKEGFKPQTPLTKKGKHKASGYPDIEFKDQFDRTNYLECKTYNAKSETSSFRSFFVSPSEDFKVIEDAHHIMLSFELYDVKNKSSNNENIYKCKKWKVVCLADLICDVKYEFNSNNKNMYSDELVLAEGSFK
ncbi:MAG: hypothetical protein FWG85_06250 [Bacteroidetes bacterium]|nr:hypothetical protein [Bacteroidota bacterium]